jgi:beta-lactamase superfamily II metal-dependent hydrolase
MKVRRKILVHGLVRIVLILTLTVIVVASCTVVENSESAAGEQGHDDAVAENAPEGLEVDVLDVGEGDAVLVRFPGGSTMLVDGGPNAAGEDVLLPFFTSIHLTTLEYVVATHPDADHCGGLDDVVNNVHVLHVWENGQTKNTATWNDFAQAVQAHGLTPRIVHRGDAEDVDGCDVEVFNADQGYADVNSNGIVLAIICEGGQVLLTGDATEATENDLIGAFGGRLHSQIVKVPHHGSSNRSPAFPGAVDAEYAIFSVGPNSYGHPNPDVAAEWEATGAEIFRTDQQGTIVGEIHNGVCQVHAEQ